MKTYQINSGHILNALGILFINVMTLNSVYQPLCPPAGGSAVWNLLAAHLWDAHHRGSDAGLLHMRSWHSRGQLVHIREDR